MNYLAYPEIRVEMVDALQLRFSLVGVLFDSIYRNMTITTDWSVLLSQLMCNGVIDLQTNRFGFSLPSSSACILKSAHFSSLYPTVHDMLTTIIHHTIASDTYNDRDENKKHFINLVKKIRKEVGDKASRTKRTVKQLLPTQRLPRQIVAVESNEKSQYPGIDLIDRVPGLRATEKHKVNSWDLLEGNSKNPAPLSWAWFGAIRMERRQMKYEKSYHSLKYHTHNLVKPRTYFYEALQPGDMNLMAAQNTMSSNMQMNMNMNMNNMNMNNLNNLGLNLNLNNLNIDLMSGQPVSELSVGPNQHF